MDLIFSGIISGISVVFIFLLNLLKQNGFFSSIVNPLVGGLVIFGIVTGVQLLISRIFDLPSLFSQFSEGSGSTEEKSDEATGKHFDAVIGDEENTSLSDDSHLEENQNHTETAQNFSNNFSTENVERTSALKLDDDIDSEINDGFSEEGGTETMERRNSSSSYLGKDKEEVIQEKLGFDASYEDMAKAIRTTLKRDER